MEVIQNRYRPDAASNTSYWRSLRIMEGDRPDAVAAKALAMRQNFEFVAATSAARTASWSSAEFESHGHDIGLNVNITALTAGNVQVRLAAVSRVGGPDIYLHVAALTCNSVHTWMHTWDGIAFNPGLNYISYGFRLPTRKFRFYFIHATADSITYSATGLFLPR